MNAATLCIAAMLALSFTACGNREDGTRAQPAPAGTSSIPLDPNALEYTQGTGRPVTLNVYINYPTFDQSTWGTDAVSTTIIEKTGVNLVFDIAPDTDNQKLNLLIASDNLPDMVLTGKKSAPAVSMIENGMVYSYDELMKTYAPKFAADSLVVANRPYLEYENTSTIYIIPHDFTDRTKMDDGVLIVQGVGYYVRQDLLDAIGSPPLKSLDDLELILPQVVKRDAAITHPIMLWNPVEPYDNASGINVIYQSMGGRGRYWLDNGQVKTMVRDPKYKQALLYVNRLLNKGLINIADFTDQNSQQEVNNATGNYFIAAGPYWRSIVAHEEIPKAVPGADIQPLEPLLQPGLTEYFSPARITNGDAGFFITKKTKYPDRCIWLQQYLNTREGMTLVTAGIENVHWEWGGPEKKYIVPINEGAELMAKGWVDWTNTLGTYKYRWSACNYYDSAFAWGLGINDSFKMKLYTVENFGSDYSAFDDIEPLGNSDEGVIFTKYYEAWKSAVAKICMTKSESEASALYNEFITAIDRLGMESVEQYWTAQYNARNK
jgi:putative aldouronate transport system substrate-binding protein